MANASVFAENLNRICREKGTTVSSVLKDLGLSTSKVTLWNNGSLPKLEIIRKLADYLHCEVSDFFKYPSEDEIRTQSQLHDLTESVRIVTRAMNTPRDQFDGTDDEYRAYIEENRATCRSLIDDLEKFKLTQYADGKKTTSAAGMEGELIDIFRSLTKSQQYKLMAMVYEFAGMK